MACDPTLSMVWLPFKYNEVSQQVWTCQASNRALTPTLPIDVYERSKCCKQQQLVVVVVVIFLSSCSIQWAKAMAPLSPIPSLCVKRNRRNRLVVVDKDKGASAWIKTSSVIAGHVNQRELFQDLGMQQHVGQGLNDIHVQSLQSMSQSKAQYQLFQTRMLCLRLE